MSTLSFQRGAKYLQNLPVLLKAQKDFYLCHWRKQTGQRGIVGVVIF